MPEEEQRKQAIAIRYKDKEDPAPKVVAKGAGYVAEQIVSAAKQHSVPVYKNKTLTAMLMAVDLDREIPPELYQAVAEVLASHHPAPLERLGLMDCFAEPGSPEYLFEKYGLTAPGIVKAAEKVLARKGAGHGR